MLVLLVLCQSFNAVVLLLLRQSVLQTWTVVLISNLMPVAKLLDLQESLACKQTGRLIFFFPVSCVSVISGDFSSIFLAYYDCS